MKLIAGLLLFAAVSFGQGACETSPELKTFYSQIKNTPAERIAMLKEKLAAEPDDLFLNRWYIESPQIKQGSLAEAYRAKLATRPDDAAYLYLYGAALMGTDTPKAIEVLGRAIAKDPLLPWTYWDLIRVYSSPGFRDAVKVTSNLMEVSRLCPDDVAFPGINMVTDPAALRELASRFRKAVEARATSGVAAKYPMLWAAEFRVAKPEEYDRLRAQVAEDMKRAKELDPANTATQQEGYRLIGDMAAAKALDGKRPKRAVRTFDDAFNEWSKAHPWPTRTATEAQKDAWLAERLAESEKWVKDFPDEVHAEYWKFISFAQIKSTPDRVIEAEGDLLLKRSNEVQDGWSAHPYEIDVAEVWNRRDIRLKDIASIAAEGLKKLDHDPSKDNDMLGPSQAAFIGGMAYNIAFARFQLLTVQADAARKLDDWDRARAIVAEMKGWLDAHPGDYIMPESNYLYDAGRLADHDGKKLDALAYYQRSLARFPSRTDAQEQAHTLWLALEGSEEGFDNWMRVAVRKPAVASTASQTWTEIDKPLTSLHASDMNGKSWTIAEFKGKTTFINIWATWCAPCREELPEVQKLYEKLKDRTDVQVITIDVDTNPGLIGPFLRDNHYSFPVVMAKSVVDQIAPEMAIPRNWIVDGGGTLRRETIGFNRGIVDWPDAMIKKLGEPLQ